MPQRSIWAVLFVPMLLALAALACSVDVSTAHFENAKLFKTAVNENPTRSFKSDETVFCITDLRDVEGELPVRIVWNWVEEAEGGEAVITPLGEKTFDLGNGQVSIALPPPEEGWPKGSYTVDLYLDGDKKETLEFSVK